MNDGSSDGRIGFEVDGETLAVSDRIEGTRLDLRADREPELSPALPELFPLPVDRAVSFEAESVSASEYSTVVVRRANGDFLAQLDEPSEFPRGDYCVEINGVTKVLLRVEDAEIDASGMAGSAPIELVFDRPTTVTVGARSLHTRPEATVTVPDDPAALTEAVSVLGSSIREFSPERSWPTLRGYPPRIERGDELDIPSPLTVPDTGVEVVVRPTYADVYRLSTLSYYLGARMTVGDAPAIRLETGYEERLPTEGEALEQRVKELFGTWFFLDTLARTEGYVPSDRYEYEQVGAELPFYPPNLADSSMSERLMEYLEVDPETVAPYAPAWATEAVLRPAPEAAELLPHLAHVLAPVRVRGASDPPTPDAPVAVARSQRIDCESPTTKSETDSVPTPDADPIPPGTSVLTPDSYENALRRGTASHGDLRAVFLFESDERAKAFRNVYADSGASDGTETWSVLGSPGVDEVSDVLTDSSTDVVYCGLPVVDGVIVSRDGGVEVGLLGESDELTSPGLVVLEGTEDVEPGVELVNRGALGAVILDEEPSPGSIRRLLGLLSVGGPVSVATALAVRDGETQARFVGEPAVAVSKDRGFPLQLISLRSVDLRSMVVERQSFMSTEAMLGMECWTIPDFLDGRKRLAGTHHEEPRPIGVSDVLELHSENDFQICLNGDLVLQGDDLSLEDIEASARRALSQASETESHADTQCRN